MGERTKLKQRHMAFTQVTIDGVKYEIDVDGALDQGTLRESTAISAGQYYEDTIESPSKDRFYLLAGVWLADHYHAVLVNLQHGVCYTEAIPVKDTGRITAKEWTQIIDGDHDSFRLVSTPNLV